MTQTEAMTQPSAAVWHAALIDKGYEVLAAPVFQHATGPALTVTFYRRGTIVLVLLTKDEDFAELYQPVYVPEAIPLRDGGRRWWVASRPWTWVRRVCWWKGDTQ